LECNVDPQRIADIDNNAFLAEGLESAGLNLDLIVTDRYQWSGIDSARASGRGTHHLVPIRIDDADLGVRNRRSRRVRYRAADAARSALPQAPCRCCRWGTSPSDRQ